MKRNLCLLLVMATILLGLAACGPKGEAAETAAPVAQPQGLIAQGRLQPQRSLEHAFPLSGQVGEVLVGDGEHVAAGQPLARLIESPEINAVLARAQQEALAAQQAIDELERTALVNLTQARLDALTTAEERELAQEAFDEDDSNLNAARLEAARAAQILAGQTLEALEENAGINPAALAAAQARLQAAAADMASAQAAQEAHTLNAHMDGTVIDLDLAGGDQVAGGAPVIELADTSSWIVQTDNLTELEVTRVKIGQQVEVVLDALPEAPLSGEVTRIAARYSENRGDITYTVTVRLKDVEPQMRWGMTAAVRFIP